VFVSAGADSVACDRRDSTVQEFRRAWGSRTEQFDRAGWISIAPHLPKETILARLRERVAEGLRLTETDPIVETLFQGTAVSKKPPERESKNPGEESRAQGQS
jgi:hypothetical protein